MVLAAGETMFYTGDLSAIKFAYEKLNLPPVIGVIGGDILMDYKGIINYKNLTLTLSIK
jgi:hypothetical protein